MFTEFQLKGNPLVKCAPTAKKYFVVEDSPDSFAMYIVNKTQDIPYCDTFHLEEHWQVKGHPKKPDGKGVVIHYSFCLVWHKSTMMKSMIRSSSESQTKANAEKYFEWAKSKYPFKAAPEPPKRQSIAVVGPPGGEAADYTTKAEL